MKKVLVPVMFSMILFTFSCSSGSDGSNDTAIDTDPEFTHIAESWVP